MENLFLSFEVFLFIFCLLNILKNAYAFIKVFRSQEGKLEIDTLGVILFGLSLSYTLTTIIMGFKLW